MHNNRLETKYDELVNVVHKVELQKVEIQVQIQSLIDNQKFLTSKMDQLSKIVDSLVKHDSEMLLLKDRLSKAELKISVLNNKVRCIEEENIEKKATKRLVWWQVSIIAASLGAMIEFIIQYFKH